MPKLKLHLGSGEKYIPGFVHVDIADFKHIDYKSNIGDLSMFGNNTVDLIYCCHAFEYFDRMEAGLVLTEWYRVLKKGGVLRLAVPDFENIVKVYQKYDDLEHRGILGPLYGHWVVGNKVLYHKTVYDYDSLKNLLESVGFKDYHRYDADKTEHASIDDFSRAFIPHMDKKGICISLNVEVKK
jgi:predicted SAM-dependent methyltransferase